MAGAITGLLFVSLSIAPERLTGEHASVEQQSIAATAFTALVDALWISLFALRPGNNIPGPPGGADLEPTGTPGPEPGAKP